MEHSTKKLGMMFTVAGWILGFLLLVLVFARILDQQNNPNQSVSTVLGAERTQEIVLQRNRRVTTCLTAKSTATRSRFLVDTGATTTAIPAHLQQELGLRRARRPRFRPPTGVTTAYLTRLDQLALGDIELNDVNASIIGGMAVDEVLLGMNVLKHFELIQRVQAFNYSAVSIALPTEDS